MTAGAGADSVAGESRLIKRYANRKLYDTGERRFTSLGAIRTLVRRGVEVVVVDHATGEDRTAETLGQTLGQRRGMSGAKGLGLGVLEELIRAPERLDRALSGEDSDAEELRELRDEVHALSRMIDNLLSRTEGGGRPGEPDGPDDRTAADRDAADRTAADRDGAADRDADGAGSDHVSGTAERDEPGRTRRRPRSRSVDRPEGEKPW